MWIKRLSLSKTVKVTVVAGLVQLTICVATPVNAANAPAPSPMSEQAVSKETGLLENRFFAHQYANDPVDKRLERLELMVFGGTQDGSNEERLHRLKKVIAERPQARKNWAQDKAPSAAQQEKTAEKGKDSGSSQYPVLNTLEWRALKKTYPTESLDQRLGRLEQKLFGQDSPTMAYADRVDRLKRTLGVGITAMEQTGPLGPAPKARPRGSENGFNGMFGAPNGNMFGGIGSLPGFGDDGDIGGGLPGGMPSLSRTFSQMFQDMNREMQEFNKLGPGNWVYDSNTGDWVEQQSGRKVHPGPQSKLNPTLPGIPNKPSKPGSPQIMPKLVPQIPHSPLGQQRNNDSEIPAYADPNSI